MSYESDRPFTGWAYASIVRGERSATTEVNANPAVMKKVSRLHRPTAAYRVLRDIYKHERTSLKNLDCRTMPTSAISSTNRWNAAYSSFQRQHLGKNLCLFDRTFLRVLGVRTNFLPASHQKSTRNTPFLSKIFESTLPATRRQHSPWIKRRRPVNAEY